MATRKPTDKKHKDRLPGEDEMERVYRAAAKDMPPESLDANILAEAQRAVAKPKAHTPFGGHWAIPLSTAAVIVLSLGVVMLLSEQGALNHRDVPVSMVAEAPPQELARSTPAAPPAASVYELAATEPPVKAKSVLPEAALRARMEEERINVTHDAISAKSKLAKEASSMGISADVIAVQVSGQPGAYQFSVGIRSPDKGCSQYADWWEVVSTDGKLLYRRVLLHSHVGEQPFTRSGGPVSIQPESVVWVRAHMNTGGYGGAAFKGSVKTGFANAEPPVNFAPALAKQPPLPDGCAF